MIQNKVKYIRIHLGTRGLQGQDSIDTGNDVIACVAARDAAIAAQVGAEAARTTSATNAAQTASDVVACQAILDQILALP